MNIPQLQFATSVPSKATVHDHVVLGFELANAGPQAAYVNTRFAVAPEVGDVNVSIRRDGEDVPFQLRVRLRPLAASDFLLLEPGHRVVAGYVLTRGFQFDVPGVYTIWAEYACDATPPELEGQPVFRGKVRASPIRITITR